jgi:hypothetical protein
VDRGREGRQCTGDPRSAELGPRQLSLALQRLGAAEDDPTLQLAQNSLTNARAMETLHRGFANRPWRRFLPADDPDRHADDTPGSARIAVATLAPIP